MEVYELPQFICGDKFEEQRIIKEKVNKMAPYKNNNYGGNNSNRNNRNYKDWNNNRTDRHFDQRPDNKDKLEIDYSEILNYLKKPEDSKKYNLFSIKGTISNTFAGIRGGSQMRKFYDSVVDICETARDMEVSKGRLAMILPIAYYANKRDSSNLDKRLFDFIKQSIKELNSIGDDNEFKKSLEAFKDVFQAIVAYTKESNR